MFYNILRAFLALIFLTFFRWRVSGTANIPASGGAIIASNHLSFWDPPVIGTAMSRRIHFMAKEELFSYPVLGWIIRKLNAFPVRRGMADRAAIRTAVDLLERGETVGIFPEGTRSKTGQLGRPEPGLALIAIKAGVPIVPAAIVGTDKVFRKGCFLPQFTVKFGKPITVQRGQTDREYLDYLSSLIMTEIANLLQEGDTLREK